MASGDPVLGSIFIVDDEKQLMLALADMLRVQGYAVRGFESGQEALEALGAGRPDLLLTDLMMPGMTGVELMKAAMELDPALVCLLMTGQGTVQTAVEAMRSGAFDYILKPFKLGALLPALARAIAARAMRQENVDLKATVAMHELGEAISRSLSEQEILNRLAAAALAQCGAKEALVLTPTAAEDRLVIIAAAGKGSEARLGHTLSLAEGLAGWKALRQESVEGSWDQRDFALCPELGAPGLGVSACVPILGAGRFVGMLGLCTGRGARALSEGQVRALQVLCRMAGAAVQNARLFDQVRQAEEKYRTITEHITDLVALTDLEGTYQWVNPAHQAVLGYEPEVLAGTSLFALVHPEDLPVVLEGKRALLAGEGGGNLLCRLRHARGHYLMLEGSGRIILSEDGKPVSAVFTSRDVTERMALQARLQDALKLETMGMITSGVAHEVRNPLNAINILSAALAKKLAGATEYQEYLGHIRDQVERLSRLMSDLLVLGRPRDEAQFTPCDIERVAREAISLVESADPRASGRMALESSGGPFAMSAAQNKLVQVFMNLLSNALSFSPEGAQVVIRLDRLGREVAVSVRDSGPGIPEKLLPELFTPFKSQRKGGTGLGLAIVKKIVADHGGSASAANNEPGPGACFTVRLPLDAEQAPSPAAPGEAPAPPPAPPPSESGTLTREEVAALPRDLASDLRRAVTEADLDRIMELVERARATDARAAAKIAALASRFEYRGLLDLLGPMEDG